MIAASLPLGSNFGWGVCGENLKREFAKTGEVVWVDSPINDGGMPALQAISGPTFEPACPWLWSSLRNVGYTFIEDFETAAKFKGNAAQWDKIAVGSTWCAEMMKERLGIDCPVVIQGVDTDRFKWDPNAKQEDTFNIFSGGKFEFRKGQDLVIAAFKVLAERYRDVKLICSWRNLWPATMISMKKSQHIKFEAPSPDETAINGWSVDRVMALNGIDSNRFANLPLVPHTDWVLPHIYNECDMAVFPNRCEAGTNLPLMECMACGLPVIATYATGHIDVLRDAGHLRNNKVQPNGWVEPDLEELIEAIDWHYNHRNDTPLNTGIGKYAISSDVRWTEKNGRNNRAYISRFTWEKTAAQLIAIAEG